MKEIKELQGVLVTFSKSIKEYVKELEHIQSRLHYAFSTNSNLVTLTSYFVQVMEGLTTLSTLRHFVSHHHLDLHNLGMKFLKVGYYVDHRFEDYIKTNFEDFKKVWNSCEKIECSQCHQIYYESKK